MRAFFWNIGDYAAATAHLSWDQDAAYKRLLAVYYLTQRPLPREVNIVIRMVSAQKPVQKRSTIEVLREFFTLEEDGWHQKRCDAEIAKYSGKSAQAKKAAAISWQSRRNADASKTHTRPQSERNAITTLKEKPKRARDPQPVDNSAAQAPNSAPQVHVKSVAIDRESQSPKPTPWTPGNGAWWTSENATIAKGAELGVFARAGETRDAFIQRIHNAIAELKRTTS